MIVFCFWQKDKIINNPKPLLLNYHVPLPNLPTPSLYVCILDTSELFQKNRFNFKQIDVFD